MTQKENRLVVGDASWAETIPKWLLEEVRAERMAYGLASIMTGGQSQVGNAEVAVYLYTASLRQPLSSEHTNIYLYLVTQLFKKRGKDLELFLPEDIRKESLSDWEECQLKELRGMIYSKRGGEINHPLLSVMKQLKKSIGKVPKDVKEGQLTLF